MSIKASANDTHTPRVYDWQPEKFENGNLLVSNPRFVALPDVLREFSGWKLCEGGSNPFQCKKDGRWMWRLSKKAG